MEEQITYERDLNHTYLVYEGVVIEQNYEMQMLLNNKIPGILPCSIRRVDGQTRLCYEISARQPLNSVFEKKKLNYEMLSELFYAMRRVIRAMEEFLLPIQLLAIQPSFIYTIPGRNEFCFCLFPTRETALQEMRELMEFLLNVVDYTDEKAVAAAYECYRESEGENVSFVKMLDRFIIDSKEESEKIVVKKPDEMAQQEKIWENKEYLNKALERAEPELVELEDEGKINENSCFGVKKELGKGRLKPFIGAMLGLAAAGVLAVWLQDIRFLAAGLAGVVGMKLVKVYKKREQKEKEAFLYEEDIWEETEPASDLDNEVFKEEDKKEEKELEDYGATVFFTNQQTEEKRRLEPMSQEMPELELISFPYIIGKLESAVDGVVAHPTVSRIHCKIIMETEGCYIIDLNSTNGTVLNGEILEPNKPVQLHLGDEIQLGKVIYVFQ